MRAKGAGVLNRIISTSLFLLSLCLFLPASHAQQEVNSKIDGSYANLIEQKKYHDAYDYIKDSGNEEDKLFVAYHLFFGSGVDRDACAAVYLLEPVVAQRTIRGIKSSRYISLLNVIYNGNWPALASLEGSAIAAYFSGSYYEETIAANGGFHNMFGEADALRQKMIEMYRISCFRGFDMACDKLPETGANKKGMNILDFEKRDLICKARDVR